jgi:MFS family permease
MLMIVLDVTVVNVALPSIQDDLGFSQSSLAWVVNAYLIAFGGLLLLAGRFGAGLSFPALMTLAMSGATQNDAGLASGLVNTSVQVGGALGLAVLATLSTTRSNHLADGEAAASALTSGYYLAFLVGAGLVLAAIVVAVTVLEPGKEAEVQLAPHGDVAGVEPCLSEAA